MAKLGIQQSKFGYKSLTLKKDTVKRLQDAYNRFQDDSGKPLKNYPTLSEFLDTALTVFSTPKDKLPRLMLVSKNRTRTVIYDSEINRPVVLEVDKRGDVSSTRVDDEYVPFCKRVNPAMFTS